MHLGSCMDIVCYQLALCSLHKLTLMVCAYRLTNVSLSRLPTSCGPLGPCHTSRSSISLTYWLVKLLQSCLGSTPKTWRTSYGLMPGMLCYQSHSSAVACVDMCCMLVTLWLVCAATQQLHLFIHTIYKFDVLCAAEDAFTDVFTCRMDVQPAANVLRSFLAECEVKLVHFAPQNISNMLWACATLTVSPGILLCLKSCKAATSGLT